MKTDIRRNPRLRLESALRAANEVASLFAEERIDIVSFECELFEFANAADSDELTTIRDILAHNLAQYNNLLDTASVAIRARTGNAAIAEAWSAVGDELEGAMQEYDADFPCTAREAQHAR